MRCGVCQLLLSFLCAVTRLTRGDHGSKEGERNNSNNWNKSERQGSERAQRNRDGFRSTQRRI